ncbi:OVARIAN TUMOR DOMAIN-containing deubiquitinating enzyme 12-like isoform X2 [Diospyros lotus]|uniref:OVARIAN TUMOR DOMAIN-containing deubiquitinating enzyme 12-like isoform X2 n=1 Tax=Diospyros lotus TaxID=55363 RepID=UPI00225BD297|nr:OVARIAN TUMOR DOMAIN-containing deubiquitinating enzyme 12-like isoform X2 [Diospyros lotus]
MCEPDSDVAQWGLRLLDVDQLFSSTYFGDNNQSGGNISREQYIQENNYSTDCGIENDETIAIALQEEYSKLSIAEESETPHTEEHLQASSITAPEWVTPSIGNYYPGYKGGQVEGDIDDMGPSSSCSSPENKYYDEEDYSYNLEITDESALDGEVGKRLNQMIPVPHVPRINGDIPSIDEVTSDHQRLLDRLQLYGLVERKVQGDGNCQFRALSDQFYRTAEHHKFVRQEVVNQLKSGQDMYEAYVPMEYDDYLKKMSESGEWGDHVTLQAAADSYGVKILVITSYKDTCYIEILPKFPKSKRVIFLSFWAEVHYNSIYPPGDELLPCDPKRKKKWWPFGSKH